MKLKGLMTRKSIIGLVMLILLITAVVLVVVFVVLPRTRGGGTQPSTNNRSGSGTLVPFGPGGTQRMFGPGGTQETGGVI